MSTLATQLAARIEEGAAVLAALARDLTDAQWRTVVPRDGRTVGVIVHHVASMYPIEMGVVAQGVAGQPITEVTWEAVAEINAAHARENADATKQAALELLAQNSRAAAATVRGLTSSDLARTVPFSLSFGAPMTVQFIIEDHPLRHPWHHAARIRAALGLATPVRADAAA
ncbi:MAG TPA: DinB family protein [Gemmatimonadales bacterium]|nr:DinB family protein [Gemmatimonadales bacterium]